MQLSQRQIHRLISLLFGLSPLIMLIFMGLFIYEDRNLYPTGAAKLRVVTIAPFFASIPFFLWKMYLKVRYLRIP